MHTDSKAVTVIHCEWDPVLQPAPSAEQQTFKRQTEGQQGKTSTLEQLQATYKLKSESKRF